MLRAATRDKNPISTSRGRKGHAASPRLRPSRISLSGCISGWKAARPPRLIRAESALREAHSGYILFSSRVFYLSNMFSFYSHLHPLSIFSFCRNRFFAIEKRGKRVCHRDLNKAKVNSIKNSVLIIYYRCRFCEKLVKKIVSRNKILYCVSNTFPAKEH